MRQRGRSVGAEMICGNEEIPAEASKQCADRVAGSRRGRSHATLLRYRQAKLNSCELNS